MRTVEWISKIIPSIFNKRADRKSTPPVKTYIYPWRSYAREISWNQVNFSIPPPVPWKISVFSSGGKLQARLVRFRSRLLAAGQFAPAPPYTDAPVIFIIPLRFAALYAPYKRRSRFRNVLRFPLFARDGVDKLFLFSSRVKIIGKFFKGRTLFEFIKYQVLSLKNLTASLLDTNRKHTVRDLLFKLGLVARNAGLLPSPPRTTKSNEEGAARANNTLEYQRRRRQVGLIDGRSEWHDVSSR